jgi:tetratricopeptide (TPR) repeat protein
MKELNPKWIKVGAAAAIVVGLGGYLAWSSFSSLPTSPTSPTSPTIVDRGLSDEQEQVFLDRIAEFETTVRENEANGARDISVILSLGNLHYQIGDLEAAAKWYRDILRTHPEDAPALENLAQVQMETGDWTGAEASLFAAANVAAYEPTYIKYADLIAEHFPERQAEIQGILEVAIANLGQTSGLLSRLARWYAENDMLDEAISHYEVALKIDPSDQAIPEILAELKAERRDRAERKLRESRR